MEKSYSDWKSLPVEILTEIFRFAATEEGQENLSNYALVCKAWRNPAQSTLYSHVTITSILQLEKFRDIIRCNTYFGTKVKVLNLKIEDYIDDSEKAVFLDNMTNLLSTHLSNLESLRQGKHLSYIRIQYALLDFKLEHLKSIQVPQYMMNGYELLHYVFCAFLMKDRLREVYITNVLCNFSDEIANELAITNFQKLYDNLNQFTNLTAIEIRRQTDDGVQVLEHIVETCRSLRDIDLTLSSVNNKHDHIQLQHNIDFDMMSQYIPRYNIKTLTGCLYMPALENSKVLLYIMKKFPNLEELYLSRDGKNVQVTPYIITQLLNYLNTIKEGYLSNLTTIQSDIYKTIGNFWNTKSKPGVENVIFSYSNDHTIEAESIFHIDKDPVMGTQTTLNCSLKFFDQQPPHIDFMEKNGKFIGDLTFEFVDDLCDTPKNFWNHIFMHCPNLRNLQMIYFNLSFCTHSEFDKINRYSIDKFTLKDCHIDPGILEQLSTGLLSKVKQLHLVDIRCYNDDQDEDNNISRINMPQTKIQRIILGLVCDQYPTYVKLFVVADRKYYYFHSDSKIDSIVSAESSTKISEQTDEKAFNEADENYAKFYVCCQTKPEIIFEYSTY